MTLDELAPWLFGRATGGIRWGLETTRELLAGVDDPHRRFDSILIGGTNGKGSVAALCDAALRADGRGRHVGLYTSPHLVSFTERIRIDGRPVAEDALLRAAGRLRPAIEQSGASFFEATTAIAFLCFAEAGVDLATVEVGLGGRLDATNVLDPVATAVTNISRDHTDYLGESLTGIAREKAGIFRCDVPALIGETDDVLRDVLRECGEEIGARVVTLDDVIRVERVEAGPEGSRIAVESMHWGTRTFEIPLVGAHQVRNALVALELLGLLPENLRPGLATVRQGFSVARWPGRLQVENIRGTTWILDVAHNPAGATVLAAAVDLLDPPRPVVVVAGILADKDWRAMLPPVLTHADACILTTPPSAPPERRWDPDQAADWVRVELGRPAHAIADFGAALERASTLAPHGTVLVTGSVHTVGDAMARLGIDPA